MSDFVENMKKACKHLEEARSIMSRGPLDFYLAKLAEHSEALLTKFAPFKVGETVALSGDVPCKGGWTGCEKTLSKWATGKIVEVDYYGGLFYFDFAPDNEWYSGLPGEYIKCDQPSHSYRLMECWLTKVQT
jgi:hypothetical protein